MPRQTRRSVSKPCVPVSTTETHGPKNETRVTAIGRNKAHEMRLLRDLVELYGWTLCEDGNLYRGSYAA